MRDICAFVCWLVDPLVCQQDYTKMTEQISTELGWKMALGPEQTPLTFDEGPIKGTGLRVLCNFFNHHETFLLISHGITHGSCWIKFCNCGSKISDLNIVNLIIYSICIFGDSNNSQWTFINHCLWNKIGSKLQFLHYPFTLKINLFFS